VITSGPARPGGRILLVEDDADAALFATRVLAKAQFTVTHTADPAVALRLVAGAACDLVLTEADLPGLRCQELVAAARRLVPRLPVVILTGRLPETAEDIALRALTSAYLTKPVAADHLVATVTRLL
jgi:DNA-binding response OmpR family regulator